MALGTGDGRWHLLGDRQSVGDRRRVSGGEPPRIAARGEVSAAVSLVPVARMAAASGIPKQSENSRDTPGLVASSVFGASAGAASPVGIQLAASFPGSGPDGRDISIHDGRGDAVLRTAVRMFPARGISGDRTLRSRSR